MLKVGRKVQDGSRRKGQKNRARPNGGWAGKSGEWAWLAGERDSGGVFEQGRAMGRRNYLPGGGQDVAWERWRVGSVRGGGRAQRRQTQNIAAGYSQRSSHPSPGVRKEEAEA